MKKILCSVLSAVMFLSGAIVANAEKTFSDLNNAEWAEPYILEMSEMNFISGYPDGSFKPNNNVTHLESLVLFSRAMGSTSEAMEKVVEYAVEEYSDKVSKYGLSFGQKEVCFMLYRGALTVDELDSYIASGVANTPMPRHKAAVIITKAMAAEKRAKAELILDLTYEDAKLIPAASSKYVYFVTQEGIMSGVGGNYFAPNSNVTRAQIAVMLSRVVDKMGISFVDTTLKEINTLNGSIVTADETYEYTSNTNMYSDGIKTDASSMPKNVAATFVIIKDEVVFVDAYSSALNGTRNAIFYDYFTSNNTYTIRVKADNASDSEYIECAEKVKLIRNGETVTMAKFEKGDRISLTISNGLVTVISAEQESININNAVIENIVADGDVEITISHSDSKYDGAVFFVANNATLVKNGVNSELSTLLRGDKVNLTIEYGKVVKIKASSTQRTVDGTIKEIHISSSPYMIVDVNGQESKYDILANVKIKVNGADASIYDFRLMDTVKITIESQAITSISATALQSTAKNITAGTVVGINSSYGSIRVSYTENGVTKEETVNCKKNTDTQVVAADGKSVSIKDIKEGSIISVRGNIENGLFVATLIIIEEQ